MTMTKIPVVEIAVSLYNPDDALITDLFEDDSEYDNLDIFYDEKSNLSFSKNTHLLSETIEFFLEDLKKELDSKNTHSD